MLRNNRGKISRKQYFFEIRPDDYNVPNFKGGGKVSYL